MKKAVKWAVLAPMAWPAFLFLLSAFVLPILLVWMIASCTPAARADAKGVLEPILDVAGAVCTLEQNQPEPDWLAYVCTLEQAIAPVVGREQPKPVSFRVRVRKP